MSSDWMCTKCNFKIFGYKSECLKCKSNRPTISNNESDKVYTIKQVLNESIEIINNINIQNASRLKQRNEDIERAIDENRPKLHYVNISCSLCKKGGEPPPHNCWKYS